LGYKTSTKRYLTTSVEVVGTPAKLSRQTRNGTPIQTPSRITDYFARRRNRGGSCHHRHRSRECPTRSQHGYISVVTPPQRWQSPEQQAQRHAQYEARVKSLLAIALKDERVQALLAGKNYTVVGIVFLRPPPLRPVRPPSRTLLWCCESRASFTRSILIYCMRMYSL